MSLSILYRGPLSSCNYDCNYCPFAKRIDSKIQLADDERRLANFVTWCAELKQELSVFFTPWGEALTRRWYWQAFEQLTAMQHVSKVAVQTNLSCSLNWLDSCNVKKVGIWATFHPSQSTILKFLNQLALLSQRNVSHSVGMVGLKEDFATIQALRDQLPPQTYLWINAYKSKPDYYISQDVEFLTHIDPLFPVNNTYHSSLGRECTTGNRVISVDGLGDIRRCHFVKSVIGNIYRDDLESILKPRKCPNTICGCHIGYVHLPHLGMQSIFGSGLLERVPITSAVSTS